MKFAAAVLAMLMVATSCAGSEQASSVQSLSERADWGEVFAEAGAIGTFVLRDVGSTETMVWDMHRASTRRLPASTFKILNSLIILETGVLPDTEAIVVWDGLEREGAGWDRDHSLRTAIEVSAVWVYQELARQVGSSRMQQWVEQASYGNADIGGGIDQFWLTGELRVSPLEQLDFLEAFARQDLPFGPETTAAVADILVRERGQGWTWSYKTGTAQADTPPLGWLVGFVSSDDRTVVFAMNIDLETVEGIPIDPQLRIELARKILAGEGALPA